MEKLNSNRKNEKITGLLFIAATTTAIIGLKFYDPVLQNSDFLTEAFLHSKQISLGAFFELMLAIANIGTGIMLYPYLKKYSESLGLGYTLFRLLEVVFILIGLLSMLSIIHLSNANMLQLPGHDTGALQTTANMLRIIYGWCFILGPHFMLGVNTLIYSYIFFQTKLVPKKLAIFGMTGAVLIFIAALQEIFGFIPHFSTQIFAWALPIAVYEMVLAAFLLIKGFNTNSYENI
jgi:hypothetical protein